MVYVECNFCDKVITDIDDLNFVKLQDDYMYRDDNLAPCCNNCFRNPQRSLNGWR
jgi:hypothetical protein